MIQHDSIFGAGWNHQKSISTRIMLMNQQCQTGLWSHFVAFERDAHFCWLYITLQCNTCIYIYKTIYYIPIICIVCIFGSICGWVFWMTQWLLDCVLVSWLSRVHWPEKDSPVGHVPILTFDSHKVLGYLGFIRFQGFIVFLTQWRTIRHLWKAFCAALRVSIRQMSKRRRKMKMRMLNFGVSGTLKSSKIVPCQY